MFLTAAPSFLLLESVLYLIELEVCAYYGHCFQISLKPLGYYLLPLLAACTVVFFISSFLFLGTLRKPQFWFILLVEATILTSFTLYLVMPSPFAAMYEDVYGYKRRTTQTISGFVYVIAPDIYLEIRVTPPRLSYNRAILDDKCILGECDLTCSNVSTSSEFHSCCIAEIEGTGTAI